MELIFWAALAAVCYTYLGYPILIFCLAKLRRPVVQVELNSADLPALTVVIAVHNEQDRLLPKIANLRGLNYPAERLQILFVSDGSTDQTNLILRQQSGVILVDYPQRQGKQFALNQAMLRVSTPVVVFTDVRQMIEKNALQYLLQTLMQPGVGAVSGELQHWQAGTQTAAQIGLYWRYEKWIRQSESAWASTVGATGALLALFSADFQPLAADTILDDFEQPMCLVRAGKQVKLDSRAQMFDDLQVDIKGERSRKIRTLSGNFQSFARHRWLFSPLHNPLWWQFISHKVLRLLMPYGLAVLLCSALFGPTIFHQLFGLAQLGFYGLALLGAGLPAARRYRLVSLAHVFFTMNWAAVLALFNYCSGRLNGRWEKT